MLVRVANADDAQYAELLCEWYQESAKQRKTGIAKRNPAYVERKMRNGNAIIAFDDENKLAGFSYIETYEEEKFVVNSGLIVRPDLRSSGIGKQIKKNIFKLSRTKFPNSKIFSITTSLAVMRMNTKLGYKPVTFSEISQSEEFWNGCKSCKNYSILMENERKMCLCNALMYDNIHDKYNRTEEEKLQEKIKKAKKKELKRLLDNQKTKTFNPANHD